MPLAKKNLSSLDWKKKISFRVEDDYFKRFEQITSLSDIVKTFDTMEALELWKDPEGNYHWATCATLSAKEIGEKKRVVLTYNQVMLIPDVKAEFNAWKKKKSEEPPKKLCGFRTPLCVLESLDKSKKPRAPATPKKSKEEKEFEDAKEVAAGKKKKPVAADTRPAAVLSKQTSAALAGMDIDDAIMDAGENIEFQPVGAPSCVELDVSKEYTAHLQVLHLMSLFEDQENQEESLIERINDWVTSYRQSEAGTAKKTLVKWAKTSDPDFKNLLAGFGMSVLAAYKNKVVNPFVTSVNDKLKEVISLYKELQGKIKSSQVFVNQLKADKERLADDLQSMLAKNRALETELEEKKNEVASLFKQLEERKKQEEKDDKKKREEELAATLNDPAQTVISSSGSIRKRDEPSPAKKKSSSSSAASAALADSDDEEEMEIDSGKVTNKKAGKALAVSDDDEDDPFSKPVAKKRTFGDSDDDAEESKPTPKKAAVPAKSKAKPLALSDDEDDDVPKRYKPVEHELVPKSTVNMSKIAKSMNFGESDDEEESKPTPKATPKAKPNAAKYLLDDE